MLAALIVGVWTALYLGTQAGVIAAAAVALAMLAASFIPGVSIAVYTLVIAWCATLYFIFPKLLKTRGQSGGKGPTVSASAVVSQVSSAWSWAKKKLQR